MLDYDRCRAAGKAVGSSAAEARRYGRRDLRGRAGCSSREFVERDWVPLYELLSAEGFEVLLVNPAYTHQLRGRPKTDRPDCQ